MSTLKSFTLKEVVEAPKAKVWEVLFTQFGEVHTHNPNLDSSHFMGQHSEGALGCKRHCSIDGKTFVEEKISKVEGSDSFELTVTDSNFPMVKEMKARYEVHELSATKTEVELTFLISTAPSFMVHIMKGQMKKLINKYLIGLKYYLETGKEVSKDNFSTIAKAYKNLAPAASF